MMDKSLEDVCDAIKKIAWELKPKQTSLSFVIVTGKDNQGKSALLQQSALEELNLSDDCQARLFYNQNGIFLELGESWLHQRQGLLKNSLKQLNRCHRYLKITALMLCMDVKSLFDDKTEGTMETSLGHEQLLNRFVKELSPSVDSFLVLTKADGLAGFTEFYQNEHQVDLNKPLGFKLRPEPKHILNDFQTGFEELIESLGQQVIQKLHPARSGIKRSLIREFPLQVLSLRQLLQALLQRVRTNAVGFRAIYFCSAEQGGVSIDQLNKKIQHEFNLLVQDQFSQATNYRSYFIEGMIKDIQSQTALSQADFKNHYLQRSVAAVVLVLLAFQGASYLKTDRVLSEAHRQLKDYENLMQNSDSLDALAKLQQAKEKINQHGFNNLLSPNEKMLQSRISQKHFEQLQHRFMPELRGQMEAVLTQPTQKPLERYQTLKAYLMLSYPEKFSSDYLETWLKHHSKNESKERLEKKLVLLRQYQRHLQRPIALNQQLISETRQYLNALPANFLFYQLAQEQLDGNGQQLQFEGFQLSRRQMPAYFTRQGYPQATMTLKTFSEKLQQENWILERGDMQSVEQQLLTAYHRDYVNWWRNFLQNSRPLAFQNFNEGRQVFEQIIQAKSMEKMIQFAQEETRPDISNQYPEFNRQIASQFADLNLMNEWSIKQFSSRLKDVEKLLATLAVMNDEGQTAFRISRNRFNHKNGSDPLSLLYHQAQQLPFPLSNWSKQLADESWMLVLNSAREHINHQWQTVIIPFYAERLASHYPLDAGQKQDVNLDDFTRFFAPQGMLSQFSLQYIKPFINTNKAKWRPKSVNGYQMPISEDNLQALMRANVIQGMFFKNGPNQPSVNFSLQKISLDPVIANFSLTIGQKTLKDNQSTNSYMQFNWPHQDISLSIDGIDGKHYEMQEKGVWALFRLLDKVNLSNLEGDSSSLEVLFEINANSGRYLLKASNALNPFTPGILNAFELQRRIV